MSKKRTKKSGSGVKNMATDSWEKIEQIFAARVAMVLNAMQIPTHDDVQELADRVAELTRVVEKLSGKPVAATRKVARKKSASKKKAVRKKRTRPASKRPASRK